MARDIFVSYSRRDNDNGRVTELIDRIKAEFSVFEGRELDVFIDREITGMEDWRLRILTELRESHMLLVCLSGNYLKSEYCKWEFIEYLKQEVAHGLIGEGVAPIYLAMPEGWDVLASDEFTSDWISELRRRQHFDLRAWYEDGEVARRDVEVQRRMAELVHQIRTRIRKLEVVERSLGNVDARNPHFIGRVQDLRTLREATSAGQFLTVIHGIGGIGKTSIAVEYAHSFAHLYGGGRWQVHCEGRSDLRPTLASLAPALGVNFKDGEESDIDLQSARIIAELRKFADTYEPHRCLLILDNVDESDLLAPAQMQRLPSGSWLHIIATSRLGEAELHGLAGERRFLPVDELPESDALRLIESYQPSGRLSDQERQAALEIARLLGGQTLAVEAAAVFLGEFTEVACRDFLERLRRDGLAGLENASNRSNAGLRHGEKLLTATLRPTLERLKGSERMALMLAALLPGDHIALPWIRTLVAEDFPEIGVDAEPGLPDAWLNLLRRLLSLRLWKLTNSHDDRLLVARMHVLLQMVVSSDVSGLKDSLEEKIFDLAQSRCIWLVDRLLNWGNRWEIEPLRAVGEALLVRGGDRAIWIAYIVAECLFRLKRFRDAEPLLRGVVKILDEGSLSNHILASRAFNDLAVVLLQTNRPQEAEPLLRRAVELNEKTGRPELLQTSLGNLASFLKDVHQWEEAEELMRRTLTMAENNYGPTHAKVVVPLNNLATLLFSLNRLEEAEQLMRRALAIYEESHGQPEFDVTTMLNNLAQLLKDKNRLEEAELLMRRALSIDEQNYGFEHREVARDLDKLAMILMTMNRLEEAESLMRRALAILEKVNASEKDNVPYDFNLANSLNNMAQLLIETNRLVEAEPLLRCALAIDMRCYGSNHPDVARDLNNLALLLQATKRFEEAEPLMRRALEINEQVFGSEHEHVSASLSSLAQLLQATNRLEEAEPLMRRALAIDQQSCGPEHPRVAIDISNFAALLVATSRREEAEPLMRHALGIMERSYGPEHPQVAIALNNLGELLTSTRANEAEILLHRALAIDEQSYGPEHPRVATALNNLALLMSKTDRLIEAEGFLRRVSGIFERSYGADHPNCAVALNNLAAVLSDMNRLDESETLKRRALAILEGCYGSEHPDVAACLNNLATLLQETNRLEEASQLMLRTLNIFLRFTITVGHVHPHLSAAILNYAGLLRQMGWSEQEMQTQLNVLGSQYGIKIGVNLEPQANVNG